MRAGAWSEACKVFGRRCCIHRIYRRRFRAGVDCTSNKSPEYKHSCTNVLLAFRTGRNLAHWRGCVACVITFPVRVGPELVSVADVLLAVAQAIVRRKIYRSRALVKVLGAKLCFQRHSVFLPEFVVKPLVQVACITVARSAHDLLDKRS